VVIEDLNARGMMSSRRTKSKPPVGHIRAKAGLNRRLADASFGELCRMLTYKCSWYGCRLVLAPRFFASSRRCSGRGQVRKDLGRRERIFDCPGCGAGIDRDLNAARNLAWWAEQDPAQVAASAVETKNARGGDVSPGRGWADLDETRTENDSEPAGPDRWSSGRQS